MSYLCSAGPVAATAPSRTRVTSVHSVRDGAPRLRATRRTLINVSVLYLIFFSSWAWALTEEEKKDIRDEAVNFQYSEVTAKSGLKYRVPEDMPIETRGGIEAPIPFDEYVYGKFKKMDARLAQIESALERIEKALTDQKPKQPLKA